VISDPAMAVSVLILLFVLLWIAALLSDLVDDWRRNR